MRKTLFIALLSFPLVASAYGNRNWLSANQHYSENISDNSYSWGYNYHAKGVHTTVQSRQNRQNWAHEGNLRNHSSPGTFRWKKMRTAQ